MARTAQGKTLGSTLVTLVLSGAAVLGYLSYRALTPVPIPPEPEPAAAEAPAALAEALPEFTLQDLAGERQAIRRWSDRALVVNFWATWCPPCLREIPLLKSFQDAHGERGVQVIGIAVDRWDPVTAFAEEMQFNYPVLVGQAEAMDAAAAFGVEFFGLPFTVFTAPEGRVLGVHTGELKSEHLDNFLAVIDGLETGLDIDAARAQLAGRR